jgi:hypothetical protein
MPKFNLKADLIFEARSAEDALLLLAGHAFQEACTLVGIEADPAVTFPASLPKESGTFDLREVDAVPKDEPPPQLLAVEWFAPDSKGDMSRMVTVVLDRETSDFAHLIGKRVVINDDPWVCEGVDSLMHAPPFKAGEVIAMRVRPGHVIIEDCKFISPYDGRQQTYDPNWPGAERDPLGPVPAEYGGPPRDGRGRRGVETLAQHRRRMRLEGRTPLTPEEEAALFPGDDGSETPPNPQGRPDFTRVPSKG